MKKRRIARRVQSPTVWEALNEPIAYPSNEFAQNVLAISAAIVLMAWVAPYWDNAQAYSVERTAYSETGVVAGEQLYASSYTLAATPDWYYVAEAVPGAVAEEFGQAAYEVLDISEPVGQVVEFYEPGVTAVWDAWIELMADPY